LGQLLTMLSSVTGTTVYGLIGQDVMKEHRGVIDVDRSLLFLMDADRDPAPVDPGKCAGKETDAARTKSVYLHKPDKSQSPNVVPCDECVPSDQQSIGV
jgi:hypothetical protein